MQSSKLINPQIDTYTYLKSTGLNYYWNHQRDLLGRSKIVTIHEILMPVTFTPEDILITIQEKMTQDAIFEDILNQLTPLQRFVLIRKWGLSGDEPETLAEIREHTNLKSLGHIHNTLKAAEARFKRLYTERP